MSDQGLPPNDSAFQPTDSPIVPRIAKLHVVLFQPEIPQNTGNIGRTCVAVGAKLWIVRPTGFRLDDSHLKRAGLDYWQHLDWEAVDDWDALTKKIDVSRMWFFTKFAEKNHYQGTYATGDVLVFGSETNGLPPSLKNNFPNQCVRIPSPGPVRSLNLATSVGIGVYEMLRQIDAIE